MAKLDLCRRAVKPRPANLHAATRLVALALADLLEA